MSMNVTRLAVSGIAGRMGQRIAELASSTGCRVASAIERLGHADLGRTLADLRILAPEEPGADLPLVDLTEVRPGDPFGFHPEFVSVNPHQNVSGIHVRLEPLTFGRGHGEIDPTAVRAALNGFREHARGTP